MNGKQAGAALQSSYLKKIIIALCIESERFLLLNFFSGNVSPCMNWVMKLLEVYEYILRKLI